VFVRDVQADPEFAPYAQFALSVPFRAVLSCPLISTGGELVGVVSALSEHNFQPSALELSSAEDYARELADAIVSRTVGCRTVFAQKRADEVMRVALAG
jgi:hypothetical protein